LRQLARTTAARRPAALKEAAKLTDHLLHSRRRHLDRQFHQLPVYGPCLVGDQCQYFDVRSRRDRIHGIQRSGMRTPMSSRTTRFDS
jgi:hypothetical protein